LDKLKVRHISTSGLFDLLISKVSHVPSTMVISTKFKVDTAIRMLTRYVTL